MFTLPEPANDEIVPVGAVKAQHIHDGFAFGRIDELPDAQERVAAWNGEKFRDAWVGGGGVHLLDRKSVV